MISNPEAGSGPTDAYEQSLHLYTHPTSLAPGRDTKYHFCQFASLAYERNYTHALRLTAPPLGMLPQRAVLPSLRVAGWAYV